MAYLKDPTADQFAIGEPGLRAVENLAIGIIHYPSCADMTALAVLAEAWRTSENN
jgi:hypothetical protein